MFMVEFTVIFPPSRTLLSALRPFDELALSIQEGMGMWSQGPRVTYCFNTGKAAATFIEQLALSKLLYKDLDLSFTA